MMKRIPLEIKVGVLLIITVIIMVSAGFLTYRNMSSMVSSILNQARPDLGLVNLKDISANLTEADNSVRLYMVTGDDSYLDPYYKVISKMDSSINLLYKYSRNSPLQKPLNDSVSDLISKKIEIWDQLLNLRDNTSVTKTLDLLSKKFLSEPAKDSADTVTQKQSIIRRFFSRREENEEPRGIQRSELKEELTQLEKMQARDSLKLVRLKQRELQLVKEDRALTARLSSLIRTIENNENRNFEKKAYEADLSAELTYRWLIIFGISVFFLLLIVLIVIINYVRKTNASQKALSEARDEAENLARAKELFVANVSHELRSPMNAISGITEQLLSFPSDKKLHQQLDIIKKSSDHLLGVINEILDFSKIQAGKIAIEKIEFYLSDVIEEVVQVNDVLARKKQLSISSKIAGNIPDRLVGDPVRLKQVLHNLISNAVKFTEYGRVTVSVKKKESDEHSVLLEIQVSDTGVGIEESKLDMIFDDFSQEETSTARKYGGTGLGLSIVRRLVDLMGGTVRVESRKDQGTTFSVILPFETWTGSEEKGKMKKLRDTTTPDFEGLHVLIADDEEYNKVLLRMILDKWHITYHEASTGREAVEMARRHHFDVILMDVRMPVMDGITASRQILSAGSVGKKPYIIGVSATSASSDVKRCREAGMVDFVSKPYREEALKKVLARVTGRKITGGKKRGAKPGKMDESTKKLDLNELYHIGNGDHRFIYDLLEVFIRNSEETLLSMKEALSGKNYVLIADAAHRLASPTLHLRAHKLHRLLKEIEHRAREEKDVSELPALIAEAEKLRGDVVILVKEQMSEIKKLL